MSRDPVPEWFGKADVKADPRRHAHGTPAAPVTTTGSGGCMAPIAILMVALAVGGGVFAFMFAGNQKKPDRATLATKPTAPQPMPPAVPEPVPEPPAVPEPAPVPEPPPAATAEEPSEGTPLAASEIRNVMQKNKARFRACYENALSYMPNAEGSVVLSLKIGPNGRVESANTTQSGNMPAQVGVCISAITRTLKFPESSQSTSVNYPFAFNAN